MIKLLILTGRIQIFFCQQASFVIWWDPIETVRGYFKLFSARHMTFWKHSKCEVLWV